MYTKLIKEEMVPGIGKVAIYRDKSKQFIPGVGWKKKAHIREVIVESVAEICIRQRQEEKARKLLELSSTLLDGILENNSEHISRQIEHQGHDRWVVRPRVERLVCKRSLPKLKDYVA